MQGRIVLDSVNENGAGKTGALACGDARPIEIMERVKAPPTEIVDRVALERVAVAKIQETVSLKAPATVEEADLLKAVAAAGETGASEADEEAGVPVADEARAVADEDIIAELESAENALRRRETDFFIIDERGGILLAGTPNEPRTYADFPTAAAYVISGGTTKPPLLMHRRDPLPMRLIRSAAARRWEIQSYPGWGQPQLTEHWTLL
jgi:hypothetical protein